MEQTGENVAPLGVVKRLNKNWEWCPAAPLIPIRVMRSNRMGDTGSIYLRIGYKNKTLDGLFPLVKGN